MILKNINDIIDFIKKFEGFSNKAYQLKGENFYTIGYGTAKIYPTTKKIIKKDDTITLEQAKCELLCWLEQNALPCIENIQKKRQLNNNQIISLCSLIYNCGNSFKNSKCYKFILNNQDKEAIKEWDFGIKTVNDSLKKGIIKRRNEEIQLFFGVSNYFI